MTVGEKIESLGLTREQIIQVTALIMEGSAYAGDSWNPLMFNGAMHLAMMKGFFSGPHVPGMPVPPMDTMFHEIFNVTLPKE